jgi:hypothetical protein
MIVTYTLDLPKSLPPAHRGRAYRFSYDLVVSLTVLLPGQGKRQKSKDIHIPIRVWANISLSNPIRSYDILKPIIQTKDEAVVETGSLTANKPGTPARRRSSAGDGRRTGDTVESFRQYANHLLETVASNEAVDGTMSPKSAPLSPSKVGVNGLDHLLAPRLDMRKSGESSRSPDTLLIPVNGHKGRPRQGSFVKGDDELLADIGEQGGCGQAVEVLSRHSTKSELSLVEHSTLV